MRIVTYSRCLLLAAFVCLAGWSLTATAYPQAPQPPVKPPDVSDDFKAKLEALIKEGKLDAVLKELKDKEAIKTPAKTIIIEPKELKPGEAKTEKTDKDTYHFEMRAKPWKEVIEWLADKTQMAFIGVHIPTGTFTFIPPKGKQYTLAQVIDIINEGLLTTDNTQKFILIRREHSFTLVPASETIDPAIVPHIKLEELEKKGRTEVVRITKPLKSLIAEAIVEELKKMMSKHAMAVALPGPNWLVLQDTAGSLQEIVRRIDDIETGEGGAPQTYSHKCVYVRAKTAETILRGLIGTPLEDPQARSSRQPFSFSDRDGRSPFPPGFQFPGSDRSRGPGGGSSGSQMRTQPTNVHCDENSNTVFVTGPADKIAQARSLMEKIDSKDAGEGGIRIEVIQVSGDATALHALLTKFLGDVKAGGPNMEPDIVRNAIIVRGSGEQIAEVKKSLSAIVEGGRTGSVSIIQISGGGAVPVAEELQRMLQQLMNNPIRAVIPESDKPLPPKPPSEGKEPQPEEEELEAAAPEEADDDASGRVLLAAQAPGVTPQEKKDPKGKPGAPITIMAVGDRIIIRSEDPEALRMAEELLRLITRTDEKAKGDFQVIRLTNANATEAARLLDEMYNGTRQQRGGGGDGGNPFAAMLMGMRGPGGGGSSPQSSAEPRVRVVADPGTNSLLIRANPVDMLAIRKHIKETIDSGVTDSNAVIKQWVLPPLKHANVAEVAYVVQNVYREFMSGEATRTMGLGLGSMGGGSPFGGGGSRGGSSGATRRDSSGNIRQTQLTIGVDERSNLLVLGCSKTMHDEVKALVDQLDDAAKTYTKTVKIVRIDGLDPALVQQAIDAVQGRSSSSMSPFGSNGSRGFGGGGSSPFGGGGMSPFGGSNRGFGGGGSPFGGGGSGIIPFGGGSGFNPGGSFRTPGSGFPGGGGPGSGGPGGGPSGGGFRGRGPGGGGGPAPSIEPGGPDFFESRVTDDPQVPRLYDPQQSSVVHLNWSFLPAQGLHPVQLAGYQDPGKPAQPGEGVRGPRQPVTSQALPELGVIVISGNNPADVQEILRIIDELTKMTKGSGVVVRVFPLQNADATSVVTILNQLFSRINPSTSGTFPSRQPTTPLAFTPGGAQMLQQPAGSVVMIPLPRYNSILIAAPEVRMPDIEKEILRLDMRSNEQGSAREFSLQRASATRVADLLNQFYAQRFPGETATQNQIRIIAEPGSNKIIVQAANADWAEIKSLIERLDNSPSSAINELRIIKLNRATADEVAYLLTLATTPGTVAPSTTRTTGAPGQVPGAPGAPGAFPTTAFPTTTPGAAPGGALGQTGFAIKATSLRFFSTLQKMVVESGWLDDIRIIPDARTNSLIIAAPKETMNLLYALVRELDVDPAAQAVINIFPLKKSDALAMGQMLQSLFLGTGATGTTGTLGTTGVQIPRPQILLSGTSAEGAPIVDLRLAVDQRTNSLIVAGSPSDLRVIDAMVNRLEDSDVQTRRHEVYHLRNTAAADVANALTTFLANSLNVLARANQINVFQELERDIIIVPEAISNKLLISATPQYFSDLVRLIQEIDAQPPQVVIQVLIAEVDHTATEEFGMELGLQTPVLFTRSMIPAPAFQSTASSSFTTPATGAAGLVPPGTSVTSGTPGNPVALPGFLFNTTAPLGNNPVVNPSMVGWQGIGNLGVGRSGPSGVGGFVLSAASDSFSMLLRALKTQGRVEILSRPQVMALDNQTAQINVGQSFPIVLGQTITATGLVTNDIDYRNVGVILTVTPKISPDGTVLMRVRPEISSVIPTQVPISNTVSATAFNVQAVETTVVANDGETVALGGLITKIDQKNENKIPWFGDLPYVGAAFRFRTHTKSRVELLVILTPHIIRSRFDTARILSEEARRIDWVLGDVLGIHGPYGMEPVLPHGKGRGHAYPQPYSVGPPPSPFAPATPPPSVPSQPFTLPAPGTPLPGRPAIPGTPPPGVQMPPAYPNSVPYQGQAPHYQTPAMPTVGAQPYHAAPMQQAPHYQTPAMPTVGAQPYGTAPMQQAPVPQVVIRDATPEAQAYTPLAGNAAASQPHMVVTPQAPFNQPASFPAPQTFYPPQPGPVQGFQPGMGLPPGYVAPVPAEPSKETRGWNLFQRRR